MLHAFTWQHFLIAATVLTVIWYAGFWLWFRRASPGQGSALSDFRRDLRPSENEPPEEEVTGSLMGKPRLPEGLENLGLSEFGFAGSDEALGLLPDVMQELRRIFSNLEEEDGSKADFFNRLEVLKMKFPGIRSSKNLQAINEYIRERVPFLLSLNELENLWD